MHRHTTAYIDENANIDIKLRNNKMVSIIIGDVEIRIPISKVKELRQKLSRIMVV